MWSIWLTQTEAGLEKNVENFLRGKTKLKEKKQEFLHQQSDEFGCSGLELWAAPDVAGIAGPGAEADDGFDVAALLLL